MTISPILTDVRFAIKSSPISVTTVPPAKAPELGKIDSMVGGGT